MSVARARQFRDQSIEDINTEVFADGQSRLKNDPSDVIIFDLAVEIGFGGSL